MGTACSNCNCEREEKESEFKVADVSNLPETKL
jgi:hypothetical protein